MTVRVRFDELVELVQGIDGVPSRAARPLAAALAIEAGILPREERMPPWLMSELQGEALRAALRKWKRAERVAWKGAAPALRRLLRFLPPEEARNHEATRPVRRALACSLDPWTLGRYVRALLRHQEMLVGQEPGAAVTVTLANLPRAKLSLAQRMRLQWVWLLRACDCPIRSSDHRVGALMLTRSLLRAFGLLRNPRGAWRRRARLADEGVERLAEEEAERRQYRRAVNILRANTSPVNRSRSMFKLAELDSGSWPDLQPEPATSSPNARQDARRGAFTFVPATPEAAALGKAISHQSSYVEQWEAIARDPTLARLVIDLPRVPVAGG
jgi:hypothetical protein